MTKRRDVLKGIGSGVAVVAMGGVASADDDEGGEEEAGLRVAHASPDAPAVDVLVDGDPVVEGLEFRSVTDYLELESGEYSVSVEPADGGDPVFGPTDVKLEAEDYTAVALGEVDSDDTEFTVSIFEDTNGANIGDDEARVRAIHASPDAPAVDVTVNDDALNLFEGVSFGESSGYAVVPTGEYKVEIRPAGGGDPVSEADVNFEGRSTYTAFAVGYLTPDDEPADEEFGLVPTLDKGAPPRGDGDGDDDDEDDDDGDGGGPPDDNPGRGRGPN
jgi:hypothetical protein